MKNVIVTGGAGFIGSNICKRLVREGYNVIILDNLFRGRIENIEDILGKGAEFIELDLAKHESILEMSKIICKYSPDLIMHYAAINGTEYFYDRPTDVSVVNSIGTYNLMESVKLAVGENGNLAPKLVFASTSEVYGEPFEIPTKEASTTHVRIDQDRDSYAAAKLMSEFYVKLYSQSLGLDYIILRIFNVYGPGMVGSKYGQVIPEFIKRIKDGEYPLNILGNGKHTRSFCHISDHVELTIRVLDSEFLNGVLNLGNSYEISILELAEKVMKEMSLEPKFQFKKEREGDHLRRSPCLDNLFNVVGEYKFVSLEDGLRTCI